MNLGKYSWMIVVAILIIACEKDIDIEDQLQFSPKLVLDVQNEVDSLIVLHLTKSSSLNSNPLESQLTGNVTVLLKQNNQIIYASDLPISQGTVLLPYKSLAGDLYEVQVKKEGLPSIAAKDTVPTGKPSFNVGRVKRILDYYQLTVTLEDMPGDNYFLLNIQARGKQKAGIDSLLVDRLLTFESTDKILLSSLRDWAQPGTFGLFDDQLLFDSTNTFRIQIPEDSLYTDNFKPESLNVEISHISRAMYTYYINLLENSRIYGGPLSNIKADYGNVDQGLGLFGFKNSKSIKVPLAQ